MAFSSLRTVSFRNLLDAEVDIRAKDIFLVGKNGQGKSNFLEALYFCSYASSFRGGRAGEIAKTGEKDFFAAVSFSDSIHNNLSVSYKDGEKKVLLDGKKIEDRKELLNTAPAIIFCHEDMDFVSGSPERRRWFFDQTRSLWDSLYLEDLLRYRYVLKNRNSLLKNNQKPKAASAVTAAPAAITANAAPTPGDSFASTLGALDIQLASYGLQLCARRKETAEEFSLIFEPLYREISGIGGIKVKYVSSWKQKSQEEVLAYLAEKRQLDLTLGLTHSGPHRDKYIFTQDGTEFTAKASTGQRRLLALLLRVAQTIVFSKRTGKKPVLLLDDVLLELDGEKRQKFLSLMPEYEQAFYTFLPVEPYENYRKEDTLVYYMENGSLSRQEK